MLVVIVVVMVLRQGLKLNDKVAGAANDSETKILKQNGVREVLGQKSRDQSED